MIAAEDMYAKKKWFISTLNRTWKATRYWNNYVPVSSMSCEIAKKKKKEPYTSKHLFWLTLWLPNFSWIPGTQSIAKLQILTQCQEKTTPASPISTTSQESIALYTYWHQKKQIKRKELNKVEGFRGYSIFTTDNSTINWKPPNQNNKRNTRSK